VLTEVICNPVVALKRYRFAIADATSLLSLEVGEDVFCSILITDPDAFVR
jgi:hypothetical protein